jgi:hypothetical protein
MYNHSPASLDVAYPGKKDPVWYDVDEDWNEMFLGHKENNEGE